MANGMHPAAPHHLPPFITAPGETDYFFNGSAIFLVVLVVLLGTLYFRLHALPEHLAHGSENKLQFQLIGVLCLLALFTHNTAFWVAALVLALIRIPDLATPLAAIADSLARMARWWRPPGMAEPRSIIAPEETIPQPLRVAAGQPRPDAIGTVSLDPVKDAPPASLAEPVVSAGAGARIVPEGATDHRPLTPSSERARA
jgi:hypothetical protein